MNIHTHTQHEPKQCIWDAGWSVVYEDIGIRSYPTWLVSGMCPSASTPMDFSFPSLHRFNFVSRVICRQPVYTTSNSNHRPGGRGREREVFMKVIQKWEICTHTHTHTFWIKSWFPIRDNHYCCHVIIKGKGGGRCSIVILCHMANWD